MGSWGFRRLRRFAFGRPDLDGEVEEEMALHVEMLTEELTDGGMTPDAAHDEAERRFGDRHGYEQQCRSLEQSRFTYLFLALRSADDDQAGNVARRNAHDDKDKYRCAKNGGDSKNKSPCYVGMHSGLPVFPIACVSGRRPPVTNTDPWPGLGTASWLLGSQPFI